MSDAELEQRMTELHHRFVSACATKDKSATGLWRELQALREQRTNEQRERALVVAGLTADGRCAHQKVENGVCVKCKDIVTNGERK